MNIARLISSAEAFLVPYRKFAAAALAIVLLAGTIVVAGNPAGPDGDKIATDNSGGLGDPGGVNEAPGVDPTAAAQAEAAAAEARRTAERAAAKAAAAGKVGVPVPKSGTIPPGVDYAKQEIKVLYYWADSSKSSQYLPAGTPGDTVDDGKAFSALMNYIKKHPNDGATLMGSKINLGNWKINWSIVTMNTPEEINKKTTDIAETTKPFAAITARGSLGTETCIPFAKAGIHTYATNLPYMNNVGSANNGYCVPNGISWDQQIEATVNYMKWHKTTPFSAPDRPGLGNSCPTGCARVYGFIYSEYEGMATQAQQMVARLRAAGVNIPENAVASLTPPLSTSAGQAPGVRDRFATCPNPCVNTVIMADGGSSLAFTHAAGQYRPDYYIWPCSGQDTTGYTRLLPTQQWDNASGLSCYDNTFDADLTLDVDDRQTEYYKAYIDGAGSGSEAPSSTYLVYAALQPLIEGISRLGTRDFTVENYRAALKESQPYRYDGINGRTSAGDNILVTMGNGVDNSLWGDVARVEWSPAPQNPFTYVNYPRKKSNESFS